MNPVTTPSQERLTETERPAALKFCLYARKSSEQDERQALSIDQQISEMQKLAKSSGLEVVEVRRESHSSKVSGTRPVFNGLIADIRAGGFNAILTWAPDRLSRNAGDLGALVDLMDHGLLHEIRTPSQTFTNNPNEKFLLMILGSQAKLENDNRGLNTKRGLRGKAEAGWRPGVAPLGYLNRRDGDEKIVIDPERAPVVRQMFEKVANEGATGRSLVRWLIANNFRTRTGKCLVLSAVYRVLRTPFYMGRFQYGGQWYTGKHKQLISKALFDKVQTQLTTAPKAKAGTKEFRFTRLMKCDVCGSGVTAEEKFKHLKDGSVRRYVYYHCGRTKDFYCPQPYLTEPELVRQLTELVETLPLDEIGAKEKFRDELTRYRKFSQCILGNQQPAPSSQIDIRAYAKYVLAEGAKDEQREILSCITGELRLKDRQIYVEKKRDSSTSLGMTKKDSRLRGNDDGFI